MTSQAAIPKFLTVKEVAEILQLHRSTIQRLAASGELPGTIAIKTGSRKTYRIPLEAINALAVTSPPVSPVQPRKNEVQLNPFPLLSEFKKKAR